MSDTNCPYCDAEIEICHDDGYGYAEDRKHEQQCHECEKRFTFYTNVRFYYEPLKADCLNGADHQWEMSSTYPIKYSKWQCKDCDAEKKPTLEELAALETQQTPEPKP